MNSKERVFAAVDHKRTDRVPIHATFVPQLEKKIAYHSIYYLIIRGG